MKHTYDDVMCWCDVCENYRQKHYNRGNEKKDWFIVGLILVLFVLAFINAGITEQFYLTHTL